MLVATLLGLWLISLCAAQAAPLTIPFGWSEGGAAATPAQQRARAWAQAWGGEVETVMSTTTDDDFVETVAVIEVDAPLPLAVLQDVEAGRPWLLERLTSAMGPSVRLDEPTVTLVEAGAPGVALLRGRARVGGSVVMLAVGPRGARYVAVVMQVAEGEEILYSSVFDGAVDEIDGLQATLEPFPLGSLRLVALLAWVLAGSVIGVLWTRRSLPRPGARVAGRQVAVGLAGAAGLVFVVAGLALGGSALELQLAESSPWGLALQIGVGGLVMAVVVLGGTELWERRLTPVASAPQQGSFAMTGNVRRHGGDSGRPPSSGSYPASGDSISGGHPAMGDPSSGGHPLAGSSISGSHPAMTHPSGPYPIVTPAVTGDTQVGPAPAITGDTQVGPAPAVTGDTQVGPAPAVTGNTKVGPPPSHPEDGDVPVREVIAGAIEVDTQVGPRPKPIPREDTAPRSRGSIPGLTGDTTPRGRAPSPDGPASLIDAVEPTHPALDDSIPPRPPPSADADAPALRSGKASHSDLFPKVELERGPTSSDSHPALDLPLPPSSRTKP